jgi:hypothetical protein
MQEGENKVNISGAELLRTRRNDKIMISPWMSKVNGPHEEWAERHCPSASGEKSRL